MPVISTPSYPTNRISPSKGKSRSNLLPLKHSQPKPLQPKKESLPPLNHTEAIKDATASCQQYLQHLPDKKLKAHRLPVNWDMYFSG